MSVLPLHYFLSSPYMIKEMDAALLQRAPYLMRKHKQQLTRLRRGDAACSHLVDDKDRLILSPSTPIPPRSRPQAPRLPLPSDADSDSDSDPAPSPSAQALPITTAASPSATTHKGFRYPDRPLLLFWVDGAMRFLPFHLALHSLATHPTQPPPPLALVTGGSLGLRSTVLDHKTSMHALLSAAGRTYIPATLPFCSTSPDWQDAVAQWLAEGGEGDFAIVKPSEGLKQKGLLVIPREAAQLEVLEVHVGVWRKYGDWVLQALVTDPFCVSGLDIGLVKGSPVPSLLPTEEQKETEEARAAPSPPPLSPQKGRRRTLQPVAVSPLKPRRFSFPSPDTTQGADAPPTRRRRRKAALPSQHPPEPSPTTAPIASPTSDSASASPSVAASPAASPLPAQSRAGPGQLPSDSGQPVDCLALYKCHFRVYALLRYDSAQDEYALHVCDLFKLYHAEEPMARIQSGLHLHPSAAPALTAASNHAPTLLPPFTALPSDHPVQSVASPWAQGQSISNSLAMRMGNDILSSALIAHVWPSFTSIIVDCISLALPALRPWDGVGLHAFQIHGFDLLWDVRRDEAVLLEVNENVGQGIHKRDVMCNQGMEVREYERMKRYWKEEFRRPFSEGLVHRTVDYALGRPAEPTVWTEVKRWTQGHTARAEKPAPSPKARASRPRPKVAPSPPAEEAKESMEPPQVETGGRGDREGQGVSAELPEAAALGRRSSSHRRLSAALAHAKAVAVEDAAGEGVKPFLTGQPRATAREERSLPRPTRAELHARYAVRARRGSLEGQKAPKVESAVAVEAGVEQSEGSTQGEGSQSERSQSRPSSPSSSSVALAAPEQPVAASTQAEDVTASPVIAVS